MKTLSQIEPRTPISSLPFTVTSSGSYYLTTNLTGVASANGITVQASGVTIDLRGFALVGVAGSLNGVTVSPAQSGMTIFGGVVKGWGGTGVSAANAAGSQFSQLILSQNSSHGLVVGTNSIVRDCVTTANSGDGLELTSAGFAENNNCQNNGLCGIHVLGSTCRVEANHIGANGTSGLQVDGTQNLIVKNSAINNATANYTIAANNDYGQIYASPGAGFTNFNPWANFSSAPAAPTCTDGIKNGNETDVDCGGGTCLACATGKQCNAGSDCVSSVCSGGVCAPATCSDAVKNGNETDVDCGGGTCPNCAVGKGCLVNTDCTSQACDNVTGKCVSSTCVDQKKDGNETDVDCGGGTCATCATGKQCLVDTDCSSSACDGVSLVCVSSQCADHRKDGAETDVDCGGGTCAACAVGKQCLVNTDCASGHVCNASKVCQ